MDIPKEFGERFVVGEELVQRPSCVVYRGKDRSLGDRDVAIKVYVDRPSGNEEWIAQYREEVAKVKAASHRSLVPILHGDCEAGWFYLVMELIEGNTLRERLEGAQGPLGLEAALGIISELAAGVGEIHENGAVHGHIDSRAVLFKGEEVRLAGYYPMVIDQIQKGQSTAGRLIVEPAYIAPEQISGGELDQRVDIFALAVLLFEMVTGQRPFSADNPLQTAMLRLSKEPPSPAKLNPALSPLLDVAIMKGLSRDPNERYGSVSAFLESVSGGQMRTVNPLAGKGPDADAGGGAIGDQTIGVSMSTESIREMLRSQEAPQDSGQAQAAPVASAPPSDSSSPGVMETLMSRPAYAGVGGSDDDALKTASGQTSQSRVFGGSFIVLNGEQRGQKFWLGNKQTIIGSDSGCDISLSGKGVPSRYAIVVERDEQYSVGPLSSSGLIVNDDTVSGSGDVQLKRGDVLTVGPHKLRFVEPKEVFTLQDDVADRVIDRPESNLPKILAITTGLLVVVGLVLFTMYQSTLTEKKQVTSRRDTQEERERKELIAQLRQEGDRLLKSGVLVEPIGENAKHMFKQVLDLDPDNAYAKQRLMEIDDKVRVMKSRQQERERLSIRVQKLVEDGNRFFQARTYISPPGSNARESYQEALRLDPKNQTAKNQLAEIDRILKDMVGKINSLIATARQYHAEGKFVAPPGDNAYELLTQVLEVDRGNAEAKNMIYDMAAASIVEGDRAKVAAKLKTMRKSYLTAQALGVDPAYIKPRIKGTDLIQKSRSTMIFVDRKSKKEEAKKASGKYLDSSELERRVAEYQLQRSIVEPADNRKFIEVDSLSQ